MCSTCSGELRWHGFDPADTPFEMPEMDEIQNGPPMAAIVLAGVIGVVVAILSVLLAHATP